PAAPTPAAIRRRLGTGFPLRIWQQAGWTPPREPRRGRTGNRRGSPPRPRRGPAPDYPGCKPKWSMLSVTSSSRPPCLPQHRLLLLAQLSIARSCPLHVVLQEGPDLLEVRVLSAFLLEVRYRLIEVALRCCNFLVDPLNIRSRISLRDQLLGIRRVRFRERVVPLRRLGVGVGVLQPGVGAVIPASSLLISPGVSGLGARIGLGIGLGLRFGRIVEPLRHALVVLRRGSAGAELARLGMRMRSMRMRSGHIVNDPAEFAQTAGGLAGNGGPSLGQTSHGNDRGDRAGGETERVFSERVRHRAADHPGQGFGVADRIGEEPLGALDDGGGGIVPLRRSDEELAEGSSPFESSEGDTAERLGVIT